LACCKGKAVDLLKADDVAQRLAVSRAWVYEAARSGRFPPVRIGGEDGPLRFVPEHIDRWLAAARGVVASHVDRVPAGHAYDQRRHPRTASRQRPRSKAKAVEQQSLL
jgi:predicted DNA-binding transcriptional regulator AlpA